MRASDEDALICDFAQFYGITDYRSIDIRTAAVLACGLPPESRTVRRLTGQTYNLEEHLLMLVIDNLSALVWLNGSRKGKKPTPIRKLLENSKNKDNNNQTQAYLNAEAFEKARSTIIGGKN